MTLLMVEQPCTVPGVVRKVAFHERGAPLRRRESPVLGTIVIVVTGPRILVDGEWTGSFASGLYDRPVVTGHAGEQAGVELFLGPLAARRLLGVPASELANRVVALDDLLGPAEDPAEVEAALARRLADSVPAAPQVAHALARIEATHGAVRIERLAEETGWSRRHLNTRFQAEVGFPPKTVARLARVSRAAERLRAGDDLADVAYACGFSDQPHFNREFRAFTGTTPTAFPDVQDIPAAA